jgi:hypothetical protein
MKTFKVKIEKGTDVADLININDETDRIPGAPDEFVDGEIVTEDNITMEENGYVDDQGVGTMLFAFKK